MIVPLLLTLVVMELAASVIYYQVAGNHPLALVGGL